MELEIDYSPSLYVNFGEETSDLTDIDDTMVLNKSEDKIELAKHLYEWQDTKGRYTTDDCSSRFGSDPFLYSISR